MTFRPFLPADTRAVIDGAEPMTPSAPFRRCVHVGEPTAAVADCLTCHGVRLKTRLCQLHDVPCVTSDRKPADGVRWCHACEDHDAG